MSLPNGVPCKHPGCLSHLSHPCEGCGRIGGRAPDGYDAEIWGRHHYDPLEDHVAPTYGGIDRAKFGDLTTPGLASHWNPSDAGDITLEKLKKYVDSLPTFPKAPPYYRTHRTTYQNVTTYLCNKPERPDWLPGWINFSGVQIVPDPDVTPGEFWPPEGWSTND